MRMNVSETTIVGGLTKDVEVRDVNGKKVAVFTIAVSRNYKNAEGKYESDFYDCELWGGGAEYMGRGKKGMPASAVGRFEQRNYTDKEGKRRTAWTLKARTANLGDASDGAPAGDVMADDDEIPFS